LRLQDNPSDKDVNQGTLVVFNLDASVSNDDLRHIFGGYGEVKEVSCNLPTFSVFHTSIWFMNGLEWSKAFSLRHKVSVNKTFCADGQLDLHL
jgi:RNA recognition motif-containing protein